MRKSTLMLLAFIAIAICVPIAWVSCKPKPSDRAKISITFLGYTNDHSGTRVGKFGISNLSSSAIRQWAPVLEIKTTTGSESVSGGSFGFDIETPTGLTERSKSFMPEYQVLGPGAYEVLRFPTPTNVALWRITLRANSDSPTTLKSIGMKMGVNPGNQMTPYSFSSEWIEGD